MIVELNDDIEQHNIQGSLLLDHFSNLLRNCTFFISYTLPRQNPFVGSLPHWLGLPLYSLRCVFFGCDPRHRLSPNK